jgi:hypothetical protein
MKNPRILTHVALTLALGLLSACSNSADLCQQKDVRCSQPLTCDPADGVCKCGGPGGVACGETAVCDAESNTCLSTLCEGKTCTGGRACDVTDGTCKCGGTGGLECGAGTVCDPMTRACIASTPCADVACGANETCDPSTGDCVCGVTPCPFGKACALGDTGERTCVEDKCAGNTCANDLYVCDPNDGRCKCNGAVCQGGEACGCPDGSASCATEQRACVSGSACGNVQCAGGTTCDPADGQCKCGGPGGDICTAEQLCNLGPPARCQGGEQCLNPDKTPKLCGNGTTCDPEDGRCKCGGRGGELCESSVGGQTQICVESNGGADCRVQCNPLSPLCGAGTSCYFDEGAATPDASCAAPTDQRALGASCNGAEVCFDVARQRPLHCAGRDLEENTPGRCRAYCRTSLPDDEACPQIPDPHACVPIEGAESMELGFCEILDF